MKKITCHSTEDQIQARKEIDFHKRFNHPNILPLIGSDIKGQADIVHNITSDAFLVLPYFQVITYMNISTKKQIDSISEFWRELVIALPGKDCATIQMKVWEVVDF